MKKDCETLKDVGSWGHLSKLVCKSGQYQRFECQNINKMKRSRQIYLHGNGKWTIWGDFCSGGPLGDE